jgi:hypothetical protein
MSREIILWGRFDMTSGELSRLVLRRWYLMLLGAAISVGALYLITHRPGIYWTQFDVVLLAPVDKNSHSNKLEDAHDQLAPMAGLLVADWNGVDRPLLTSSGETTLFGEGQRQGIQVRVPNEGSQWAPRYFSPNIDVQVVDSNPETVAQEARRVSAELNALLQKRQDALSIQPAMRMTIMVSPAGPTIEYVSGSRTRAALATGLAGASLTIIGLYWTERWLFWNRSRNGRSAGVDERRGLVAD